MTLDVSNTKHLTIGIGIWLGHNYGIQCVWAIIWPNQKRALGIVDVSPEIKIAQPKGYVIFKNQHITFNSMLYCMVAAQNIY